MRYGFMWLQVWVWADLIVNWLCNMAPVLRAIPHLPYTFTLHGVIPVYATYRLLGTEIYRPRVFMRLFSLFLVVGALTDVAWCVALGLNPLDPFGTGCYPAMRIPTYAYLALKLVPGGIVYREVAVKQNFSFLPDREDKRLFYGTLAFLFSLAPLPFIG